MTKECYANNVEHYRNRQRERYDKDYCMAYNKKWEETHPEKAEQNRQYDKLHEQINAETDRRGEFSRRGLQLSCLDTQMARNVLTPIHHEMCKHHKGSRWVRKNYDAIMEYFTYETQRENFEREWKYGTKR